MVDFRENCRINYVIPYKALFERGASLLASPTGKRVVISSVGSLDRCEDDVRRYFDAAFDAIQGGI